MGCFGYHVCVPITVSDVDVDKMQMIIGTIIHIFESCLFQDIRQSTDIRIYIYIYIYTTVQKFGVTQTISCFPWKLTLLFIK